MTDDVQARLERLRERTDADSRAEVIRRALAMYEYMFERHQEGAEVVLIDRDRKEIRPQFLW